MLAALSPERPVTAGEVAAATDLARPTVSTTLSRLAKSGEVVKADRGYQLPADPADALSTAQPSIPTASPPASCPDPDGRLGASQPLTTTQRTPALPAPRQG